MRRFKLFVNYLREPGITIITQRKCHTKNQAVRDILKRCLVMK